MFKDWSSSLHVQGLARARGKGGFGLGARGSTTPMRVLSDQGRIYVIEQEGSGPGLEFVPGRGSKVLWVSLLVGALASRRKVPGCSPKSGHCP